MKKYTILVFAVLLLLSGCGLQYYTPTVADPLVKNGASIAVIAAMQDDLNLMVAGYFSEVLADESKFKVMSQKDIARKLKEYPVRIRGPYTDTSYFEIEPDFTRINQKELSKIQKKLGVDYLYVMWAPIQQAHNQNVVITQVIHQVFKGSGIEEVGRGQFYVVYSPKSKKIPTEIKMFCQGAVERLCSKTGMSNGKKTKYPRVFVSFH